MIIFDDLVGSKLFSGKKDNPFKKIGLPPQEVPKDLKKKVMYEDEMAKTKPNFQLIQKTQDRFFDANAIEKLNFIKKDVETLESLATSFDEFVLEVPR